MSNLITPEFRVSYASVFKSQKNDLNGKQEYSVVAIFPKAADLTALKQLAADAGAEKWGPDQSKWPANFRKPFRKCNERWKTVDGKQVVPDGYEDGEAVFITLKQDADKGKPQIVDQNVQDIIEPRDFYSGCWARASVVAYAYDQKGNRGVSFGLRNLQKTRDDKPFGATNTRATDDFKPIEGAVAGGAATAGKGAAALFD